MLKASECSFTIKIKDFKTQNDYYHFRIAGVVYASLTDPATKNDVAKGLVTDGYLIVEKRRERKLAGLVSIEGKNKNK